ncbi:MAG: hypothetical protein U1F14_09980 [Steroidobacteraceae bacterium]
MTLIREFAIQPSAVGSWRDFRYVFEKLGFSEGRLGTRLPKDWDNKVLGSCSDEIDRKRIECALQRHAQSRLTDPPVFGNARLATWVDEVSAAHARRKLSGVVLANGTTVKFSDPPSTTIADANEEFFRAERSRWVPCTAKDLAEMARVLFRLSPKVVLVDPHLNPRTTMNAEWIEPVKELLRVGRAGGCHVVEILTSTACLPKSPDHEVYKFLEVCSEEAGRLSQVSIAFLNPETVPNRLHGRYLISESGALRYEKGFRAVGADVSNDVSIVDGGMHAELVTGFMHDLEELNVKWRAEWPRKHPTHRLDHRRP